MRVSTVSALLRGGARAMGATRPVDFRKGPDAVAALVGAVYGSAPFSGVIYVFNGKRAQFGSNWSGGMAQACA